MSEKLDVDVGHRAAVKAALTLIGGCLGRNYSERAVDGFCIVLRGFQPDMVETAARELLFTLQKAPTPAELRAAVLHVTRRVGRHLAPFDLPAWAHRMSPNSRESRAWRAARFGGFYWLAGEKRTDHEGAGEVWAFDEDGVAARTGWLLVDPKGWLVFCPEGEKPEDQPDWNKATQTLDEFLRDARSHVAAFARAL